MRSQEEAESTTMTDMVQSFQGAAMIQALNNGRLLVGGALLLQFNSSPLTHRCMHDPPNHVLCKIFAEYGR